MSLQFQWISKCWFLQDSGIYHIQNGSYGKDINLDGLDAIYAVSWPKAIHEGNGTMQLFITRKSK